MTLQTRIKQRSKFEERVVASVDFAEASLKLTLWQRMAMGLALQGWTNEDIADFMGISRSGAGQLVRKAQKNLRKHLGVE